MSTIPTIVVTPSAAADAYGRVDRGETGNGAAPAISAPRCSARCRARWTIFHAADAKAMEALTGGGNLTEVVTALARAELTLQTATAIRDRVVQAYQDIMKMPI